MATRGPKPQAVVVPFDGGAKVPRHPKVLMNQPHAQEFWRWAIGRMIARGTWEDSWATAVALTAGAWQDYHDAAEKLKQFGVVVAAGSGGMKANSAAAVKRAAESSVMKGLAELGLTPTAAARFGPSGASDEFDDFLSGAK